MMYLYKSEKTHRCIKNFAISLMLAQGLFASPPGIAMEKAVLSPEADQPQIITTQGVAKKLYDASYALVISESNYLNDDFWKKLPRTKTELDEVSRALRKNGFEVTRVSDANGVQLDQQIKSFFNTKGRLKNTRIVFIYSGHGYYDEISDSAYLAPIDATGVSSPDSSFFATAYAMEDLKSLALRMPARQGIFIFDNCFSGMIFKSSSTVARPDVVRNSPAERWRYLDRSANTEVRQFISASGPKDTVPAKSIFMPILTEGLQGAASFRSDGYVTGKELGIFVSEEVTKVSRTQIPNSDLYWKVSGDMVFQTSPIGDSSAIAAGVKSAKLKEEIQSTSQDKSPRPQTAGRSDESSTPRQSITGKLLASTTEITDSLFGAKDSISNGNEPGCIASEYSDIKPHPKMLVAITGRMFVCYKKNGIEVTVEDLMATNTGDVPLTLGGTYIRIIPYKDGQYDHQKKISPVEDMEVHFSKPLSLPSRGTTKVPGRRVYFEMNKANYDKIRKPHSGVVLLNLIDGNISNYWFSATSRALDKLWSNDIYKEGIPKENNQ